MAHRIRMIQTNHSKPEIHRAQWLVCDADTVIENGCVTVQNNRITYAGPYEKGAKDLVVDHGFGVLMPCLVNAHTHLELSALKGKLSCDQGFSAWVQELLILREKTGIPALTEGVDEGVKELLKSGTGVVGDISTLGIVKGPLNGLAGVLFREYLGNTVPDQILEDQADLMASWAGHAPHTSSPSLLCALKKACTEKGMPYSIHVAESSEEMNFMTTVKGDWAEFLTYRGIDYSDWGLPCGSPVEHLDRLGLLDSSTVCVHMLHASDEDISCLKHKGAHVCLCPRSNHFLHGELPRVLSMHQQGIPLSLGTDSLASTPSLSLWDEMGFVRKHVPELAPGELFRMATQNGANALGLGDQFGRLAPGMRAPFIFVPVSAGKSGHVFERLIQ